MALENDPEQENTVEALQEIIRDFNADGYEFITMPQLIDMPKFAGEYAPFFKVIKKPRTLLQH